MMARIGKVHTPRKALLMQPTSNATSTLTSTNAFLEMTPLKV